MKFGKKFKILCDYMVVTIHKNSRNIMEARLWKLRIGVIWRDGPSEFYPWQSAYNR